MAGFDAAHIWAALSRSLEPPFEGTQLRVLGVERRELGGDALALGLGCDTRDGDVRDSWACIDANLLRRKPQVTRQCFAVGVGLLYVARLNRAHAGTDAADGISVAVATHQN